MLFESWGSVGRVVANGALAYLALVVLIRISGKRTLSKMNAFDLVVTVALGSTLATVLTSRQVPLVDGIFALAILIGLQFTIAWGSSRSRRFNSAVKSQPRVVFHAGELLRGAMREERITEDEIRAAVRAAGVRGIDEVESVVLESSGEISVVRQRSRRRGAEPELLRGVRLDASARRPPEGDGGRPPHA